MGAAVDDDFADFVRSRQRGLLRAAYLVCGDRQQAEDVVQEALAKLASRWDSVRNGSPDAYVEGASGVDGDPPDAREQGPGPVSRS